MNKKVYTHLMIVIGLILASLALLVACRPGALEPAGAPGVNPVAAAKYIDDPAASNSWPDRKSYASSYASWIASSTSVTDLASIEPADRKFFTAAYGCTGPGCPTGAFTIDTVHPADRKFLLASTAFAAPAATERHLLFKGSLQAIETNEVVFPTLFVDGTGSGNATQLGLYTIAFLVEVDIPTLSGPASATLIAANGDRIFAEGKGQGAPTSNPDEVAIVETYTITGGTGRFAGAAGNFTVERLLDQSTGASSGSFNGVLVLPKWSSR